MRLYDIAQEYKNVLLLLDDEDIDPQAVQDTLESIEGDFEEKADNIACIIKDLLSEAEALKNEAATLTTRAKKKRNSAEYLTNCLFSQMEAIGKPQIETSRNLLKVKNIPAALKIQSESEFIAWATFEHEEFLRQKSPEIDKVAVKEALKAGQEIPGVSLESGRKLTIK